MSLAIFEKFFLSIFEKNWQFSGNFWTFKWQFSGGQVITTLFFNKHFLDSARHLRHHHLSRRSAAGSQLVSGRSVQLIVFLLVQFCPSGKLQTRFLAIFGNWYFMAFFLHFGNFCNICFAFLMVYFAIFFAMFFFSLIIEVAFFFNF